MLLSRALWKIREKKDIIGKKAIWNHTHLWFSGLIMQKKIIYNEIKWWLNYGDAFH